MFEEIFSGSVLTVVTILVAFAVYLAARNALAELLPQLRSRRPDHHED